MTVPAEVCPVDVADGLSRAGDDRAFYRELLDLFLEDTRQRLGQLEMAVSAGDLEQVADVAHSIKGAAASLAAERARALAWSIESRGRAGDGAGLAALTRDLAAEIERVAAFARSFTS
ncbi:MAG: Hpt domain-containing protein [Acidobacteria bacterium]|jgi:HPt (histidine-containing phosphotransfer) domain-containing protein|nr:Hpt domain-containing protein [Acidobacteriota bacterium]MCU0254533.1 Hpt domain-containing protein [Acidobacteriota bacterium]